MWYQTPPPTGVECQWHRAVAAGARTPRTPSLNHEWLWMAPTASGMLTKWPSTCPRSAARSWPATTSAGPSWATAAWRHRASVAFRVDSTAGDLYIVIDHRPGMSMYATSTSKRHGHLSLLYAWCRDRRYLREYVAHLTEDLLLARFTCSGEPFNCTLWLDRLHDPKCEMHREATETGLRLHGDIRDGISFEVQAEVHVTGGGLTVLEGRKLAVTDATEVLVGINIGTRRTATIRPMSARRGVSHRLTGCLPQSHQPSTHATMAASRWSCPSMSLMPTNERMRRLHAGEPDPGLGAFVLQLRRYLLCASSATASSRRRRTLVPGA